MSTIAMTVALTYATLAFSTDHIFDDGVDDGSIVALLMQPRNIILNI